MKCCSCKSKKAKRFCNRIDGEICSLCCGSNRKLSECNYNCEYYVKEKTNRIVIGSPELMQNDNGKITLFANNCFLPNIFDLLMMDIEKFDIYVLDYGTLRIKLKFFIKENPQKTNRKVSENEAYLKDEWKKEDNGNSDNTVPLIQIYTMKSGKSDLYANQYQINERKINVKKISNYLNTFMPYGKNDLGKIEPKQIGMPKYITSNICNGEFFQGKNDTYYSELKLNEEYNFDFKIEFEELEIKENLISYSFGMFFPFELINIKQFNIYSVDGIKKSSKSIFHLVSTKKGKIENYTLVPLEGNENCFMAHNVESFVLDNMIKSFNYDRYAIEMFELKLESNSDLMCRCIYQDLPLQIGNYESLNDIYDKMYAPIKISVFNNTDKIKNIEINTIIENLSEEIKQTVQLLPKEYKLFSLCPILNINKKNEINEITKRIIKTNVKENQNILIDETHELIIFPKNLFVFFMENQEKNWKLSLSPHIARFVTPHDSCIDDIHTIASRKMPLRGYLSDNRNVLLNEIKAIYDVISEDFELEYVVGSYWFGIEDYKKQNIKLPKEVIKTKCGNCIELSLLLASCFEKLALEVYIVLIPGHAFLGIKLFGNERIYIESTMIGKRNFCEALKKGQEEYYDNFDDYSPKVSEAQIISIKDSRKIGIYPIE